MAESDMYWELLYELHCKEEEIKQLHEQLERMVEENAQLYLHIFELEEKAMRLAC